MTSRTPVVANASVFSASHIGWYETNASKRLLGANSARTPGLSMLLRPMAASTPAGPVGMVAAMAVGISYAVWAPGAMQTRLLIGGLLVPVAWAGAMAWTLADNRIVRASAVLVGTALVGFGTAMLRGLA